MKGSSTIFNTPIIKQIFEPFLSSYQADVLIHVVESNRNWAEIFARHLANGLQRKMPDKPPLIRVETGTNADLFKNSALSLFVLSENYDELYQNLFATLEINAENHFAIKSQNNLLLDNLPYALKGLTSYSFVGEADSNSYTEELQILSETITKRLRALKEQTDLVNNITPFSEPFVLVHPHENDAVLGKKLKRLLLDKKFTCCVPEASKTKTYQDSEEELQEICDGVIIIDGSDPEWTRHTIRSYICLQKRRKDKLRVIVIQTDCSKEEKDCESLKMSESVPIFKCPPKTNNDVANHVAHIFSQPHFDK